MIKKCKILISTYGLKAFTPRFLIPYIEENYMSSSTYKPFVGVYLCMTLSEFIIYSLPFISAE